jgi:hypothetical protein
METMTHTIAETPEFSRLVDLTRLGDEEALYDIEADARERKALARRFGLLDLPRLAAQVRMRRAGGGVRVRLALEADLVQACVVTLEPVAAHVEESASVLFAPEARPGQPFEIDLSAFEGDIPEPLEGDSIDIGELTAQYLALALDPYPRAPGVRFEAYFSGPKGEGAARRPGPFSALERLWAPVKKQ